MALNEVETKIECTKIRKNILEMVYKGKSGHIGGSFSSTDILYILYRYFLKYDSTNPNLSERDYFILSKGHASPLLYSILMRFGYLDPALLPTFRQLGSPLQGHPSAKLVPGVEVSTGSLGQGFGAAVGIALGVKESKGSNAVIALLGDGENQEGVVWESAMAASHYGLFNLLVIIDNNGLQIDGAVCDVMDIEPLQDKWSAFNFETHVIDGHHLQSIFDTIAHFYKTIETRTKPMAIIAKTVKGKGVSFMENQSSWHGKAPNEEDYNRALKELEEGLQNG